MFPTFTGNSRRPRNVNLSGQTSNPFAGTSWNPPSSTTGSSKSVAEAQADRQRRQQERDRLKASQQIQRTWRGHSTRQRLRNARRLEFDMLYGDGAGAGDENERLGRAVSLLPKFFSASRPDDYHRLVVFAQDLDRNKFAVVASGRIALDGLKPLVQLLSTVLRQKDAPSEALPALLALLARTVEVYPQSVSEDLDAYYALLAELCARRLPIDPEAVAELLHKALIRPLVAEAEPSSPFAVKAYRAFTLHILSVPELLVVDKAIFTTSAVSLDQLSSAILDAFSSGEVADLPKERLLWLLARFIKRQRASPSVSHNANYAKVLYLQLSTLANEIRIHFPTPGTSRVADGLPEFVREQLSSLVDRHSLSSLLDKFTFNHSGAAHHAAEDASIIAGYILTMIRCFPVHGDTIRMRLYLADFIGPSGQMPATRFFYDAVSSAKAFSRIVSNEKATLNFLLQRTFFRPSSTVTKDSEWDREWRTILLFLELYVFVLRLTDDEDFFAGFAGAMIDEQPKSRLSTCSLPLDGVKSVSLFLRNLGFTLHYHAAELLHGDGAAEKPAETSLDAIVNMTAGSPKGKSKATAKEPTSFNVISGIDFEAFRSIVATAMRMLYERDSRRRFLPQGHWLMTSRFNMDEFLSAVVLEEQRQHELREEGSDDDDDEDTDGSADEDIFMTGNSGKRLPLSRAGKQRSRHAMVELRKMQQKKQKRERIVAMIAPKLEILRNMPFVIPFETRVKIFRQFVYLDKYRRRNGHIDPDQWRGFVLQQNGQFTNPREPGRGVVGKHHAKIRRGSAFNDAVEQFYELGDGLKEPIQITFVDQFDTVEAGIDGGGVTKEFLTSVTTEAFTGDQHNLFVSNRSNALYPNPYALDQLHETLRRAGLDETSEEWIEQSQFLLQQYEFLGRIVGKCMYEGILIDIVFAGFFLLKWASSSATDSGYRASINDLREMDEDLYQGLMTLKNLRDDVSSLELDFTVNDQVSLPGETTATLTRNLTPNGRNMAVTNENRPLYISYMARHRLVAQPFQQTRAFLKGLNSIVDPSWLSMFNQAELQRLVGGDSMEIDVEDLRRNTVYSGVYQIGDDGEEHPTVQLFWRAMREFRDEERRAVLKYVTSTPRAPLLGFSQLSPSFSIRDGGGDPDRLPSASTCVNLLKLPRYPTLKVLKEKLRYAISSNAGFDLS